MDYYGLLFLYYLKGLSGKSVLRLFFNIEAGGTEQLLPENASTPTTTPILADIQYPDGLRTDQYFTYRETPTTISNKARIKTIKGNTLVWNQLVQNGNFTDTTGTGFGAVQGTVSYANNTATVVPNEPTDKPVFRVNQTISVANHRMLLMAETSEQIITFVAYTSGWTEIVATNDIIRVGNRNFIFFTPSSATSIHYLRFSSGLTSITIKNVMCFDLTQMGLDISNPSDFTSLFPLPYYAYNQGSLLSFNGNGIKTVGKNLYNLEDIYESVAQLTVEGNKLTIVGTVRPSARFDLPSLIASGTLGKTFTLSWNLESLALTNPAIFCGFLIRKADNTIRYVSNSNKAYGRKTISATLADGETIVRIDFNGNDSGTNYGTQTMVVSDIQLEIGSSATEFEPYTSTTTSLPISTYFPTGMKSAGNVYDELTESKAITRIGAVDMGTLNGTKEGTGFVLNVPQMKPTTDFTVQKILCSAFEWSNLSKDNMPQNSIRENYQGTSTVFVKTPAYSTLNEFLQAVSGEYLYFELATPTETPITTEDANEALSLLMGRSVSSSNANQMIGIITKGE